MTTTADEPLQLFSEDEVPVDVAAIATGGDGALLRRFGAVPFSVLNVNTGPWRNRKRWWIGKGLRSETGREGATVYGGQLHAWVLEQKAMSTVPPGEGVSIFDPVLAEMMYRWLCPPGGLILDPFAGGSVRGIVAGHGGYAYHGCELREEQVLDNRAQAQQILELEQRQRVRWVTGDSYDTVVDAPTAQLLFTCPPYYDLEVYSDDPLDLSVAPTYEAFLERYSAILGRALERLADDRFAVVVVGDFRERKPPGYLRPFVADTIRAMEAGGARYYQECVVMTPPGSLPVRTAAGFSSSRKFGKQHQQALIFVKGDPRKAVAAIEGTE